MTIHLGAVDHSSAAPAAFLANPKLPGYMVQYAEQAYSNLCLRFPDMTETAFSLTYQYILDMPQTPYEKQHLKRLAASYFIYATPTEDLSSKQWRILSQLEVLSPLSGSKARGTALSKSSQRQGNTLFGVVLQKAGL